mmetsp:Transcript_5883/g.8612  ORF Transcript_5883/g.8612 Transcript_5883/m.8612 type:complete len:140 (-) Transcript_5883:138-557(-)
MPLYEVIFYVTSHLRPEQSIPILKRQANIVFNNRGVIRRLSNLGIFPLAYPISKDSQRHHKARQIVMLFDAPPNCVDSLVNSLNKESSIFRYHIEKQNDPFRHTNDRLYYESGLAQDDPRYFEELQNEKKRKTKDIEKF